MTKRNKVILGLAIIVIALIGLVILPIYSIYDEEVFSLFEFWFFMACSFLLISVILILPFNFLLPKSLKGKAENILGVLMLTLISLFGYSIVFGIIRSVLWFFSHLKISIEP